jgi:hypothetical protein
LALTPAGEDDATAQPPSQVDEIAQTFGIPELGPISRDGKLRSRYWGRPEVNSSSPGRSSTASR